MIEAQLDVITGNRQFRQGALNIGCCCNAACQRLAICRYIEHFGREATSRQISRQCGIQIFIRQPQCFLQSAARVRPVGLFDQADQPGRGQTRLAEQQIMHKEPGLRVKGIDLMQRRVTRYGKEIDHGLQTGFTQILNIIRNRRAPAHRVAIDHQRRKHLGNAFGKPVGITPEQHARIPVHRLMVGNLL